MSYYTGTYQESRCWMPHTQKQEEKKEGCEGGKSFDGCCTVCQDSIPNGWTTGTASEQRRGRTFAADGCFVATARGSGALVWCAIQTRRSLRDDDVQQRRSLRWVGGPFGNDLMRGGKREPCSNRENTCVCLDRSRSMAGVMLSFDPLSPAGSCFVYEPSCADARVCHTLVDDQMQQVNCTDVQRSAPARDLQVRDHAGETLHAYE